MRVRGGLIVIIAVVALAAAGASAAQQHPGKTSRGFEHVHALAMNADGRRLWLGTHAGLFRSDDGGRGWLPVTLPVPAGHADIMTVAADPRDPRVVYAATHDAGIFRSTDGGATWTAANAGLGGLDVHGLAIDPSTPATLRSTDAGGSWKPAGKGLRDMAAVVVNPGRPAEVYAATTDGVIHRSADGGTTWDRLK
ncbi:MAG: WD40/YVTN/BNR-like repeat-containing protein [Candidatus Rokuibacteriota bacterium]